MISKLTLRVLFTACFCILVSQAKIAAAGQLQAGAAKVDITNIDAGPVDGRMHVRALVHGNIKPSNVLLTADGRRLSVQLCDFGLASQWMDANLSSIATGPLRSDDLAFTPPEQVRDCRHTSPAADIYSTGVLLYFLLSETLPFDCSSEHRLFDQILNGRQVPLSAHRPNISPELVSVIERATQHAAADRFAEAAQMRDALRRFSERRSNL